MGLNSMSRSKLLAMWCLAVTAFGAFSITAGAELTAGNGGWWLAICMAPPAILWLIWGGSPALAVAGLLHPVDASQQGGRH
jgi:hypothetical protein